MEREGYTDRVVGQDGGQTDRRPLTSHLPDCNTGSVTNVRSDSSTERGEKGGVSRVLREIVQVEQAVRQPVRQSVNKGLI